MTKRSRFAAFESSNRSERDLTSMIDVVFLLLIFFLCSMQFRAEEGTLETWLPRDRGEGATGVRTTPNECRVTLLREGGSVLALADFHQVPSRRSEDRGEALAHEGWEADPAIADQAELETLLAVEGPDRRYIREHLRMRLEHSMVPSSFSVIIDSDPKVPSAYVLWIVDLCRELEIGEVRFAVPEADFEASGPSEPK